MSESIVLEATPPRSAVMRDTLASLLSTLDDAAKTASASWNVVEAAELLLDAGQFIKARELAARVAELLDGDGRGRLFTGYVAFCDMLIDGHVDRVIAKLERLIEELAAGGHSAADMVRGGLLLARAHAIAYSMGCLPPQALIEARAILSVEFERATSAGEFDLACRAGYEMAKLHAYGPEEDVLSALAVLATIDRIANVREIKVDLILDIKRMIFQVAAGRDVPGTEIPTSAELRNVAGGMGPIVSGLVELSIYRAQSQHGPWTDSTIDSAQSTFVMNGYMSGAFEIAHKRASYALSERHIARAERWFGLCADYAKTTGYLHGSMVAMLGLFQCAMANGQVEDARSIAEDLQMLAKSEVGRGAGDLSLAGALQMLGDYRAAARVAQRAEKFFEERSLDNLAGQAAFARGACFAGENQWRKAERAWRKAAAIERRRGSEICACDRMAAVAQAMAMHEFDSSKAMSDASYTKVSTLLDVTEARLKRAAAGPEYDRAAAKLLQTRAQLCVIAQRPVEAVKHLGRARSMYVSLESPREVGLIDGLTGLALLEAGKTRGPQMFEEAGAAFQRSLDYFSTTDQVAIRWKLKYYLCVASYFGAQAKAQDVERLHLRQVAVSWFREALSDTELLAATEGTSLQIPGDSDFSPGLRPDALKQLKKALGLEPAPADKSKVEIRSSRRRIARQLH